MKIDFVRSGGFAGLRIAVTVDTQQMPGEDADRIRQMVAAAHFFEFEPDSAQSIAMPDRFEYRLTIESPQWGRRALVLTEQAVPDDMRPLIDHLTALAMRRAGRQDAGSDEASQGK